MCPIEKERRRLEDIAEEEYVQRTLKEMGKTEEEVRKESTAVKLYKKNPKSKLKVKK
tara:strand:+ start:974 stop:1144 length:171 start_codon:yes stop_codon:yes gene_type:complete